MRKLSFNIFIAMIIAFFAWPTSKADALMYRGVYVNGQVHYFSLGATAQQQTVSHQAGTVDDSTFALTLGTAVTRNVGSCTPDVGGISMNGAVFDNKIFFAYTGNPGCTINEATGQPPFTDLYVAAWDLTTGAFVQTNGVDTPTDLGTVYRTDADAPQSQPPDSS